MYPSLTWRNINSEKAFVRGDKKELFLTFDDGPSPEVTPWVLKCLAQHNIKATFFCIGQNISEQPALFKKIVAAGHAVGNHTQNHVNGWACSVSDYIKEVEECTKEIKNSNIEFVSTNEKLLFRPPYGRIKRQQIKRLKQQYKIVMWDVLSGDFDPTTSAEKCIKRVCTKIEHGSIVVFHDSKKAFPQLKNSLPQILEYITSKDFTCKTCYELH